jgi:hypothetical protein
MPEAGAFLRMGGLAVDDQEVVPGSERLMGGWY